MGWKTVCFGDERPSKSRWLFLSGTWLMLVAFGYAAFTDFVPTHYWRTSGTYIASGITTITVLFYYAHLARNGFAPQASTLLRKSLVVISLPLLVLFMVRVAVVHSVGDVYSRFVGQSAEIEAVMVKDHFHSRRGCDYRLEGAVLDGSLSGYLCVDPVRFTDLPPSAPYRLVGKSSLLGFHIDEIRVSSAERTVSALEDLLP
ncbi:hypothetical protein N7414_31300 [Pseudomonas sp. GD04087]|uniref:hypothetical protein n=1 Tax=unclassified Pseudomonas TaxID=196821 RepID=UPI00244C5B33|nr:MULTISPECIES: hypothetical protein [unclassified Pseudomonas]MDH0293629.1 hypothetical protein [Pseudomonas sp. GD04087]MDH1049579.1 hypothetical protein [Pseudomonas sp. GD03903]MDH2003813.1 hypothetical protein [Pseudomonas sp. GD03691]